MTSMFDEMHFSLFWRVDVCRDFDSDWLCKLCIGHDHNLQLVTIKVIMIRTVETGVVHDLTTLSQKMVMDHRGSVSGRGLMGVSASSVWPANVLGGLCALHCS